MFKCGYLSHGLFVSHSGVRFHKDEILPCCYSIGKNTHKLKTPSINEDILNTPLLTTLRREAIKNIPPDACSDCVRKEQITGTSPRLQNYHFEDDVVKEIVTEEDIRYLHIRLSNVCNFQCTICSPNNSHLLAKEEGINPPLKIIDDSIFDMLKEKLPKMQNLKIIIFAGGEPFYNPNMLIELLEYIPKQTRVFFHTNGSVFNKELLDRLYQFENTSLSFSFDGSGRFFEYQRRNGKWNEVFDNLKKIKENYPNIRLQCNTTISCITLPNLYDFMNETYSFFKGINLSFIISPEYYRINVLKEKTLLDIQLKMNKFFDKIDSDENVKSNLHINSRKIFDDNISHALINPASDTIIRNFWIRAEMLKIKGHDINDYVPEIRDLVRC